MTQQPIPKRRTQADRSEDTKARILDAAVSVLSAKGYAGFRTQDVAEAAGVSRGAMTHHYPSKDSLVIATLEHVFQRAAMRGRERAHNVRSIDDTIAALLKDSQDFFFSDLFLIAMDIAIAAEKNNVNSASVYQISRASRLSVESAWVCALVDAGVPVALAEDIIWLTNSIVRGLAVRKIWQNEPERFERLYRRWRKMVVGHLKSEGVGPPLPKAAQDD